MRENDNLLNEAKMRWPLTPKPKRRSSYWGCVIVAIPAVVLLHSLIHVFHSARTAARDARRLGAMGRLRQALLRYVDAHDGRLPGERWCDAIRPNDVSLDADLAVDANGDGVGFAMMPRVVGRKLSSLDPTTFLIVEYKVRGTNIVALDPQKVFVRSGMNSVRVSTSDGELRRPAAVVRAQTTN